MLFRSFQVPGFESIFQSVDIADLGDDDSTQGEVAPGPDTDSPEQKADYLDQTFPAQVKDNYGNDWELNIDIHSNTFEYNQKFFGYSINMSLDEMYIRSKTGIPLVPCELFVSGETTPIDFLKFSTNPSNVVDEVTRMYDIFLKNATKGVIKTKKTFNISEIINIKIGRAHV